jgi:hypothetical protein
MHGLQRALRDAGEDLASMLSENETLFVEHKRQA